MNQPAKPTVEQSHAVTFADVYNHVMADRYVHRRASYDIAAIVAKLALDHPGAELADIDGDALWQVMEDRITCLHSPVTGSMLVVVHDEDLITVAESGNRVECVKCERVFTPDSHMWVKP